MLTIIVVFDIYWSHISKMICIPTFYQITVLLSIYFPYFLQLNIDSLLTVYPLWKVHAPWKWLATCSKHSFFLKFTVNINTVWKSHILQVISTFQILNLHYPTFNVLFPSSIAFWSMNVEPVNFMFQPTALLPNFLIMLYTFCLFLLLMCTFNFLAL